MLPTTKKAAPRMPQRSTSVEPRERMTSDDSLGDCSAEGHHGQAAVLQLSSAHPHLALLILGEQVCEAIVACHLRRVPLEDLLGAAKLQNRNPDEDLHVHTRLTVESIMSINAHRHGVEGVPGTWDAEEIRSNKASPGKHGNAAMLQLCFTQPRHSFCVPGEAHWVELVAAPCTISARKSLCELAVVQEVDARVFVGNGQISAECLLRGTSLAQCCGAHCCRGHSCDSISCCASTSRGRCSSTK
mmetsp:Transcript_3845/g.6771  ORF Transcript_3845/g.6771 Transcript_3845/m.6771 type:complete len:244 (+) Transcript_3845:49-780(+)